MVTGGPLQELLQARDELHRSSYWPAAARSKATHLWLCDQHLAAAIQALQPAPPAARVRVGLVDYTANPQAVLDSGVKLLRSHMPEVGTWAKQHGIDFIFLTGMKTSGPGFDTATVLEYDNEPYYNGWAGLSMANYYAFAVEWARALRADGERRPLLLPLPVDNNGDTFQDGRWQPFIPWLAARIPPALAEFDGYAIHPYTRPNPWGTILPTLDKMRYGLKAAGFDKPFWITEVGWTTSGDPASPNEWERPVSEQTQADRIREMLDLAGGRADVAAVCVYTTADGTDQPSTDPEARYGVYRSRPGVRKPAADAVRAAAAA